MIADEIWLVTDYLNGDWWYYCSPGCAQNKVSSVLDESQFGTESGCRAQMERDHGYVPDTCAGCGEDLTTGAVE